MEDAARNKVVNLDISASNVSPLADAGGSYSIHERETLQLDASSSYDLEGLDLQYAWDFNGDGVFDDAQGSAPLITLSDSGTYSINLRVIDEGGKQDLDSAKVLVFPTAYTINMLVPS